MFAHRLPPASLTTGARPRSTSPYTRALARTLDYSHGRRCRSKFDIGRASDSELHVWSDPKGREVTQACRFRDRQGVKVSPNNPV